MKLPFRRCLLLAILMCIHVVVPLKAQVGTAAVTGIVEDSTGARIAGAYIKLINLQTGTENSSSASHYGEFTISGVLPGEYLLQVEKNGFATLQFSGIRFNIGDLKSIRIRMNIGSVDQTVMVDGGGLTLNTTDGSISTVVDQKFVASIPLNGRSFQDLISMTPGTTTQNPQIPGDGDLAVNGQKVDTNTFTVDGVSGNFGAGTLSGDRKVPSVGRYAGTTAIGTTQSLVSVDALQEFRVLSSTYSAEYGHAPGGQFSLLTRSGTNTMHGSLYEYLRDSRLDANDWFTQFNQTSPGQAFHQHDYGGTLGGPLPWKRSLNTEHLRFFFLSLERLHVTQPTAPLVQYVPNYTLRNMVPESLRAVFNAFPYPIGGSLNLTAPLVPTVYDSLALPSSLTAASFRLDDMISPRTSVFARYSYTPSDNQSRNLSAFSMLREHTQSLTAGVSFLFSSNRGNDLRFGFADAHSSLVTNIEAYDGSQAIDLTEALGSPNDGKPTSSQVYLRFPNIGESMINTDSARNSLRQWNVRDTFSLQSSGHLLRFGIDYRLIHSSVEPPSSSTSVSYFDSQSVLSNRAADITITRRVSAAPVVHEIGTFVQDDWRISPRLSLSAGLRWEINPAPSEANGNLPYVVRGDIREPASLALAPHGTPLWKTSWTNVAPRLGLSWTADDTKDRELLIRAGLGIYFDTANQVATGAYNAFGFSSSVHLAETSVPVATTAYNFSSSAPVPSTYSTVYLFPSRLHPPYFLHWNVSAEKALGKSRSAMLSYVGSTGRSLLLPQRTDVRNINANFSGIYYFPSGVTSSYEALQARFQQSIANGLQILGSYVLSHSLDYGTTSPMFALTRGDSDLDVRHHLELAFSWDAPKFSGSWRRRNLYSDWGLDGRVLVRTAFPVTLLGNLQLDPVTGERYYSGVNQVAGRPLYVRGSGYPGGRTINAGPRVSSPAFVLPDLNSGGNARRNVLRGFGASQVNIAIRKNVHLYDRLELQLRAETFNLFNHPDLGYIDPHITDDLAGESTLMLNQSFGSAGSLYQQGGPRSIQLMFKLQF